MRPIEMWGTSVDFSGNGGMPSTSASAAASNQMNQINQAGMPDDPDGSSRGVKRTRELRTP